MHRAGVTLLAQVQTTTKTDVAAKHILYTILTACFKDDSQFWRMASNFLKISMRINQLYSFRESGGIIIEREKKLYATNNNCIKQKKQRNNTEVSP